MPDCNLVRLSSLRSKHALSDLLLISLYWCQNTPCGVLCILVFNLSLKSASYFLFAPILMPLRAQEFDGPSLAAQAVAIEVLLGNC